MYDDISTFKKKANLANFNFRTIAQNTESDSAAADSSTMESTISPGQHDASRDLAQTPLTAYTQPGSGPVGAAVAATHPVEPRAARQTVSLAAINDIAQGERQADEISPAPEIAYGDVNNDAQNPVPLNFLFKSIAEKL